MIEAMVGILIIIILMHQIYTISVQLMSLNYQIIQKDTKIYDQLNQLNKEIILLKDVPINDIRLCTKRIDEIKLFYVCK